METDRPHRLFGSHLVRALTGFRHAPRTDMARKTINNPDFIALVMYAVGPLTCHELQCLARAWRGHTHILDGYFGPHYGWTATARTGNKRYGGQFSSAQHLKLWYRATEHVARHRRGQRAGLATTTSIVPMQRYTNDLTDAGMYRARKLLQCPPRARRAGGLGRVESLMEGTDGAL
jgi:hypothetical protein